MMAVRRAIPIATVAAIALVLMSTGLLAQSSGAPPTHAVLAESHRTIYFFSNPGISVEDHNPLVIRPSGWPLFQDGQWVLEKLHWTGWGSSVAHGKGLSSSSNGNPNAAEGKWIITPARVTLSKPLRFHGHEVYSCFRLKVPPRRTTPSRTRLVPQPRSPRWDQPESQCAGRQRDRPDCEHGIPLVFRTGARRGYSDWPGHGDRR